MEFIRSNLIRDRASATEVIERDLPTGPLSHLILAFSSQQVADEVTLAELLAFINSIEVTRSGVTIVNLQSEDLFAENCYLYGTAPHLSHAVTTATHARTLGLIIPFGRRIFDPDECYPATKKGDLTARISTTVAAGSTIVGIFSLEAVELVGATPSHYMKSVMSTIVAPGAVGDNNVYLPMGNEIIAIQLRETTFPGAASHVYGVEDARVLVDNKEYGYVAARAQCLIADRALRCDSVNSTMLLQQEVLPTCTVWLDYDPQKDGKWLLDTAGKSEVKIRLNMGVNEATYMTLMERVAV
jgi:hypothetical protein